MTYSYICCIVERNTTPEWINITRNCPWTRWGLILSRFLFRMTPAYLNAITTAGEELNAKRRGDPNGPFGECNPRPTTMPTVSAVVRLGSLTVLYARLWGKCSRNTVEIRYER